MRQLASNLESRLLLVLIKQGKKMFALRSSSVISYNSVYAFLDGEAESLVT